LSVVGGAGGRGGAPPRDWQTWLETESPIRVPSGPVEHW
jgi:hypothetical protein